MKYDAVAPLARRVKQLRKEGRVADGEILDTIRLTRLVLENKGLRSTYPTLTLYCDWLQHTEIDRHPSVWNLIESIDQVFTRDPDDGTLVDDIQRINSAFSLGPLRHELIELYKSIGISSFLFTSLRNWQAVLSCLLADLVNRPLRFPAPPRLKSATAVYERIASRHRARGTDPSRMVTSVRISDLRNQEGTPGRPPGFYFNIRLREQSDSHYAELNGVLTGTETRADFESD